VRRFFAPRWLAWHAAAAAAVVAMAQLGRWQLHRGESSGSFQNYGYAAQWWCFALFGVWFWAKSLRDARRPAVAAPTSGVPSDWIPVTAQAAVELSEQDRADPEVAAYNAWLASLAARPRR